MIRNMRRIRRYRTVSLRCGRSIMTMIDILAVFRIRLRVGSVWLVKVPTLFGCCGNRLNDRIGRLRVRLNLRSSLFGNRENRHELYSC